LALTPGGHHGSYQVLSALGAGGMGEVYRARDVKLGRDVALKVLPEAFASDKDRLIRLRREAHVLASLNHPQIAAIHGLEEADGVLALVLELVEGETLHQRLSRGPLPIEETLEVAKQIAEALEYAHEHGVVHRDLKPANVKLTPEGSVKLLDFGLAKAIEGDTQDAGAEASQSPTLSRRMSEAGLILGTAAYMSPEQARGKAVDKRADIWAYGVLLFEMLTGRRLFTGETVSDTLAAVLKSDPDWRSLPAGTPAGIRALLLRCLERDARRRLRDIGEARIAIEQALERPQTEPPSPLPPAPEARWRRAAPWALSGVLAVMLAAALWAPWRTRVPAGRPMRLSVELGSDASLDTAGGAAAVLSPDGGTLVFVARTAASEPSRLYLRRLEDSEARALAGTEGARDPFFSPDGHWIAFFAGGKLKKMALSGGSPVSLCDAPNARGGSWSEDGTIVFAPTPASGLSRISAAGGAPETLTTPDVSEGSHRWPQVLPGGKAVLFTSGSGGNFEEASLVIQPLPGGERKVVLKGGYHGRFVSSGHILYVHEGTLFAVPFDPARLRPIGQPVPAVQEVASYYVSGGAQFSAARGTLVWLPGANISTEVPIQWLDREGRLEPLRTAPADFNNIRFSPDGRRIAADIRRGGQRHVWVYEWERDALSRVTFEGDNAFPMWTPDGRRIAFRSTAGGDGILWQRADGTGAPERLIESRAPRPTSWHPSGKFLAFNELSPQGRNILVLPLEGDEASGWKPGKASAFLSGPFLQRDAEFSPDGRWIAYASNESGRSEVYVRPFPGPGGKWQVSTGGGQHPTWSRSRKELLYMAGEQIHVAGYSADADTFHSERPQLWSPARIPPRGGITRVYDLHPDSQRIAVLRAGADQAETKLDKVTFSFNFEDELRRIAPATSR
jgi:serine/threonine-protein kinase